MPPNFNHPTAPRSLTISLDDTLKSPTPRPGHGYFTRPLQGNGSSVSVNEPLQHPPQTPHTPHTPIPGLRQLGQLLPRHTYFRARVTIHQISSVPFVSGEFGVRWKFKGVQTPTGNKSGLLDRVKARAEKRTVSDKGKAREDSGEISVDHTAQSLMSPLAASSNGRSESRPPTVDRSGTGSSVSSHSSSTADTSQHLSVDWGTTASSSSTNASAITVSASPTTTTSDLPLPSPSTLIPPTTATAARGMTPFLKLKDHSVVWSQTLDTILKLDVDRETTMIQPCPLKLVVMQRVIPDDPRGSPQNPRLGAVYLNLAQYVGQGVVERKYLLKESKTNATLKITIEMTHVSGETNYTAPPLAKGEILNGIAGFLQSDIVKRRPRALDIYSPYPDEDDLGIKSTATAMPRTSRTARKDTFPGTGGGRESDSEDEHDIDIGPETDIVVGAFDVQRLPFTHTTKTTEMLIDALFNPVKISDKREESPFTVYTPPSPSALQQRDSSRSRSRSRQRSEYGLGLSGVALDREHAVCFSGDDALGSHMHVPGHGPVRVPSTKRQGSISSSVYTTTTTASSVCSSVSSRAATIDSASVKDSSGARSTLDASPGKQSVGGGSLARGTPTPTPEGRVVVGPVQEEQIGGVRAWWRKRTARPSTPTMKIKV
uniref:C2 NT-type domain-containing protein n=1 Tax=Psilocybe cubensis TaxID=181762 RepID=A0A8H7XPN8_PSICU